MMSNQGDDEFRSYITDFESYLNNIGGEARKASPDAPLSEAMTSSAENYEDNGAWQREDDEKRLSYCDDIYDEHKRLHDVTEDEGQDEDEDQYELKYNQDYTFKESAAVSAAATYEDDVEYTDEQTAEADLVDTTSINGESYGDEPTDSSPIKDVGETVLHHSYVIDEEASCDYYKNDEGYREQEMIHDAADERTMECADEQQHGYELENDHNGYDVEESDGLVHSEPLEYQVENDQKAYTEDEDYENDYENVGDKRLLQNVEELAEVDSEDQPTADCTSLDRTDEDHLQQAHAEVEVYDDDRSAQEHNYNENDDSYDQNETEADNSYDRNETEADDSYAHDEGHQHHDGSEIEDQPTTNAVMPLKPRHHVTFSIEEQDDPDRSDDTINPPVELEQVDIEQRPEPSPVSTPQSNVDDDTTVNQPTEDDDHIPAERGRIKVLLAQWREFEQQQISSGRSRSMECQRSSPPVRSRSCGPSSGRRMVAAINPYENRCTDDINNSCDGRRSKWSPDREEENNDEDLEENRSISRAAILAKFENLGSAENKVPITTHRKAFKWTVKEPITLQRPVGLRVS